MVPTYSYTLWPSIAETVRHTSVTEDWAALARRFSGPPAVVAEKGNAPGFGPYVLKAPGPECGHRNKYDGPHRCDACVEAVTLATFDADAGDAAQVAECRRRLAAAGIAAIWCSSYSWPTKESWRLILPLDRPVAPEAWPAVRLGLAAKFAIPADLAKCSAASHFYYLPSIAPRGQSAHEILEGVPVPTAEFAGTVVPRAARTRRNYSAADYEPPAEPDSPPDLAPYRAKLRARLKRFKDENEPAKAVVLGRCLAGKALAAQGSRNHTTTVAAGIVAWALHGAPLSVLMRIVEPSVEAMQAEGSSVDMETVERLLLSAMRNRHAYQVARDAEADEYRKMLADATRTYESFSELKARLEAEARAERGLT